MYIHYKYLYTHAYVMYIYERFTLLYLSNYILQVQSLDCLLSIIMFHAFIIGVEVSHLWIQELSSQSLEGNFFEFTS